MTRNTLFAFLCLLVVFLGRPSQCHATPQITARSISKIGGERFPVEVRDAETGAPIANARINVRYMPYGMFVPKDSEVETDEAGRATVVSKKHKHAWDVSAEGYLPDSQSRMSDDGTPAIYPQVDGVTVIPLYSERNGRPKSA